MQLAVSMSSVFKSFVGARALSGLDLKVRRGEIYALIGRNGAGKSTAMRIMVGLQTVDHGRVEVLGMDIKADPGGIRRRIAYIPDEPSLYDDLTAAEYIEYVAALWQIPWADARAHAISLLHRFELSQHTGKRISGYSRGMRQKLALAGALIHAPEIIILDEPMTGLDIISGKQIKDILANLKSMGTTIILSTHLMSLVEDVADRVGIIDAGRLVAEGSVQELIAQSKETTRLEDAVWEVFSKHDALADEPL